MVTNILLCTLLVQLFALSLCVKQAKLTPRHFARPQSPQRLKAESANLVPKIAEAGDQKPAETGHYGHDSKYYMYAHVPEYDHYEFGFKRGNEHHVTERHEKAHPHEGQFKTKVRWADSYGGYGERYWDYNHAGHDDHGGDESNNEPVVAYEAKSTEANAKRYIETDRATNRQYKKQENEMLASASYPEFIYNHGDILKEQHH